MEIRTVGRDFLGEIHGLLVESLPYDRFSAALVHEKLFDNPRPETDTYENLGAFDGSRFLGFMQGVRRGRRAWLGLFAVMPAARRKGVASALFDRLLDSWSGVDETEVLALPGNYFSPGLDPRYTAALSFIEKRGFERFKDCANMIVDLTGPFVTRLTSGDCEVRRATSEDTARLDEFFSKHFGEDWRLEVERSRRALPVGLHVAVAGDKILAFAAHSSQNREWGFFGPMGTAPEAEGRGFGRVLLHRCLADLFAAGHGTAIIPWVGPIRFYAKHCGARVERVYWRFRRGTDVHVDGEQMMEDKATLVLRIGGRWSAGGSRPLDTALKRHFERGVHRIVVDGGRLESVESDVTEFVSEWSWKLRGVGGMLCFVQLPPSLQTAMEMRGVFSAASVRQTIAEAMRLLP